jgi:phospholipase/carboxylesterase
MLKTEFYPADDKSSKRLMIALHGLGDSAAGWRWLPRAMRLNWMNYLLVNAPDEYFGGYSWYDYQSNEQAGVLRSRKMIFELLDAQRTAGFPTDQTVLSGFSQGCLMTIDVGVRYPHRFAGLVGISGYVHSLEETIREFSPIAKEQRILVTHGFQDPIIPFDLSKAQFQKLKEAGLNLEWREFFKAHNLAGEPELKVIRDFVVAGYPAI